MRVSCGRWLVYCSAEVVGNFPADELEISVSYHSAGFATTDITYEFVDGSEDGIFGEVLEWIFHDEPAIACNDAEDVFNPTKGCAAAMPEVIVECVSKAAMRDGCGGMGLALESSYFAGVTHWVSAHVRHYEGGLDDSFHAFE